MMGLNYSATREPGRTTDGAMLSREQMPTALHSHLSSSLATVSDGDGSAIPGWMPSLGCGG